MDKFTAEHILGLADAYDARTLKAAFRAKAAQFHPDAAELHGMRVDEATRRMQEVNEANDLLEGLLRDFGPSLACDAAPGVHEDAQRAAAPKAEPGPCYNPFEGHRPGAPDPRQRRTTTSEYYWSDPRYQANAANARRRAEQAEQGESRYYNGEYESLRDEPQPFDENPPRPYPKWYRPLWRFFAIFPYRFVFFFAICLLVNLADPFGANRKIGIFTFEDLIILVAIVNLVVPFLTAPIRAAFLWLIDKARDLAWAWQRGQA
jgi:hypothetical protein